MEKKGILLSHFYIYKFVKNLLIKVFLYNIDLEKNIYSFFARGISTFSEAFYYRLKKKKRKKEPFLYERYKPDLFFLLFLYYGFFSKRRRKRRRIKRGFRYVCKLVKVKKKKSVQNSFKKFFKKKRNFLNAKYLTYIKKGNLKFFIKLPEHLKKKNEFLNIPFYEDKIKRENSRKLNLGFLDFLIYLFFKINMLEKQKEDILNNRKKRRNWEMVPNFLVKMKRWVIC